MEPWIVALIVLGILVVAGGGTFVAVRSRRRDLELFDGGEGAVDLTERLDVGRDHGGTATIEAPPTADAAPVAPVDAPVAEAPVDAPPAEPPPVEAPAPEPLQKPSFFDRLTKARSAFSGYLGGLIGLGKLSDDDWEELEDALIQADVGVGTTVRLLEDVRATAKDQGAEDGAAILELLKARMRQELAGKDRGLRIDENETNVWLFVGVNGVGKTTAIGKVGRRLVDEGHRPLMAAGDTFRAAAAEQLTTWAERAGADIVRGDEGGDPASVIFDGVAAAAARDRNVVLADTAGRLHNKSNLMAELGKVRRVADKDPGHVTEVLLVIDATTGQNGMTQAKVFTEAVDVTGIVLTKLDGSAKGGIVFAVESDLGIPVKLVGLGEKIGDLVDFDADAFIDALFE